MIVRILAAIVQAALFAGVGFTVFGAVQDGRVLDAAIAGVIAAIMAAGAALGHIHGRRRTNAQRIEAQVQNPGHKLVGTAIHGRR